MAALPHLPHDAAAAQSAGFAYVGCADGSLLVYSLRGNAWCRTQRLLSAAPAFLLLCPAQRTLYVANQIDTYEGLPRGTVEAFAIDPLDGRLTLLERIPLSLAATGPRHLAISPDGKLLAVAAYGGGIYNLFRLANDGRLLQPPSILKQAGCGPDAASQQSAHPHTLVFDASGRYLLSSDSGSDRLSVFTVEEGRLARRMQQATGQGSAPGGCAHHPGGTAIYTQHPRQNAVVCYRYDGKSARVGEPFQRLRAGQALAIHPSGRMLYTAHERNTDERNALQAWRVHQADGRVSQAQHFSMGNVAISQITFAPDLESLFVLDEVHGSIFKVTADRTSGELLHRSRVAAVNQPRSLALKTVG